ncbi:MAG TPA: winged helix-turn-helix domain-containing protein, partial [Caldimonas sp.]|nr:winged helix-turn-helix domain-containing protein [Caldimonas sp.]
MNLSPRLFNALLLFVEHAGELLDKDALMRALWPGVVVDENSLSQVVSSLRRALADDPTARRYIQTVPRRGFRFVATVTALPEQLGTGAAASTTTDGSPRSDPIPSSEVGAPLASATIAAAAPASTRRHWLRLTVFGAAAASLGAAALWASRRGLRASAAPPSTLAVLPFKPLAFEARDELLEVGMADSLIARLSTVPGLVVRSVGSVRRYASTEQDPMRAARELDVAWIVDGSLQRRGDQLRVTARLLRSADGVAAWTGTFDEKFNGVFEVQDAISARVAKVLAPSLEAFAGALPVSGLGGTRNTDAYQLYLAAGRYAQDMRADGLRKSMALYRQALDIDPGYALAWAGLAETHRRTLFGTDARPSDVFEPADEAIRHALAVVPDLAEARAEQAFKLYWFDFDWAGAERGFRRALALNPNVVTARFGLAGLLLNQGRVEEGFAQMRTTRELDPMSPVYNTLEAAYLLEAGRRDEARSRLNRALDIAPGFWLAHCTQALLDLADHKTDKAIAELRRGVVLADGTTRPLALLGSHLARVGEREEAREILNQLLALAKSRYVSPSSIATVYAALGDIDLALDALDQAFRAHDTRLVFLKDDPRLANLRTAPRFVALMHALKLDQFGPGLAPI